MKNNTKINVPKKYEHMIDEIYKDSDGYWVYSKASYMFPNTECHTAHEYTQAEILKEIRTLKPCDCDKCKQELAEQLTKQA